MGDRIALAGVLEESYGSELFALDLETGKMRRLAESRPSDWLPTPSVDSSRIAYFTNRDRFDALKVADEEGHEVASYPGVATEQDTRLSWLPASGSLMLFSSRGLLAFNEDGPVDFPDRKDLRAYLYADVSVRSDKVLISAIPKFGQYPGLYLLENVDGAFALTDLRFPPSPEIAAELYLQPKWSFDESKIAFTDRIDLWIMNGDGSGRKWLTDFAASNGKGEGAPTLVSHPVWSVNGEWIAHTRQVYGKKNLVRELWVMRPDGTEARKLFAEPVDDGFLLHMEDFTRQAFFDATDEHLFFTATDDGVPNLFSVTLATGDVRRLTSEGAIFPALLPEDDLVLYTSLAGNTETLMVMNSDGSGKRPFLEESPEPAQELPAAPAGNPGSEQVEAGAEGVDP